MLISHTLLTIILIIIIIILANYKLRLNNKQHISRSDSVKEALTDLHIYAICPCYIIFFHKFLFGHRDMNNAVACVESVALISMSNREVRSERNTVRCSVNFFYFFKSEL